MGRQLSDRGRGARTVRRRCRRRHPHRHVVRHGQRTGASFFFETPATLRVYAAYSNRPGVLQLRSVPIAFLLGRQEGRICATRLHASCAAAPSHSGGLAQTPNQPFSASGDEQLTVGHPPVAGRADDPWPVDVTGHDTPRCKCKSPISPAPKRPCTRSRPKDKTCCTCAETSTETEAGSETGPCHRGQGHFPPRGHRIRRLDRLRTRLAVRRTFRASRLRRHRDTRTRGGQRGGGRGSGN